MNAGTALAEALRSFAAVEHEIVAHDRLGEDGDPADLVRLRRELVMQFAAIAPALEADAALRADPARLAQATRLLSAFRSQNAINQADWPAIRVRDDRASYRASAQRVADRSRAFWQWIGDELGVAP